MTRLVGPITCHYCGGRCNDRCLTAFLTEPGVYTYIAPNGVKVTSEIGPHITRPLHLTDDWFRYGHLSFAFESYRMWAGKCKAANPAAYWALVLGTPFLVAITVTGWLYNWLVR